MRPRAAIPAGRQLGLLWGGVAAALVLLAPLAERIAAALPACPFRALTGVPCPGCGSGAAALALSRLDFAGAFAASPLAAVAWIALVAGGLAAGAVALRGGAIPEPPARLPAAARAAAVAIVLGNWLWIAIR